MKRNFSMILTAALIVTFAMVASAQEPAAPPRPESDFIAAGPPPDGSPMTDMDAGDLLDDPLGPPPQGTDRPEPFHMKLAKGVDMHHGPGMPPGGPHGGFMPPPPPPPGGHGDFFAKTLNLTDEQKKEIRGLQVGFREKTRKTRIALAFLGDERRTMMMSGKIDEQKLAKIDEDTIKAESELMRERMKMRRDRLALLTPEQLTRFAELMTDRPGHGRGHRKMR